jgi:hypothetical protein
VCRGPYLGLLRFWRAGAIFLRRAVDTWQLVALSLAAEEVLVSGLSQCGCKSLVLDTTFYCFNVILSFTVCIFHKFPCVIRSGVMFCNAKVLGDNLLNRCNYHKVSNLL